MKELLSGSRLQAVVGWYVNDTLFICLIYPSPYKDGVCYVMSLGSTLIVPLFEFVDMKFSQGSKNHITFDLRDRCAYWKSYSAFGADNLT